MPSNYAQHFMAMFDLLMRAGYGEQNTFSQMLFLMNQLLADLREK